MIIPGSTASQNDKALSTTDNHYMYLIKVNEVTRKSLIKSGTIAIYVLPFAITAMLIANVYFRKARTSDPAREFRNQTIMPPTGNPALPVTDSVKNNGEPVQASQTPPVQKEPVAELLIKCTTDESCKLKITNMDLDEVIDWDLAQNDNSTLYLKPGKYSIVAISVIDNSKSKTYLFDVTPGSAHTTQNLHIRF